MSYRFPTLSPELCNIFDILHNYLVILCLNMALVHLIGLLHDTCISKWCDAKNGANIISWNNLNLSMTRSVIPFPGTKKFQVFQYHSHLDKNILPSTLMFNCLKGLFTNFEYITFFFVSQQKKHFLWKVHLDKTTLTRNNWENRGVKFSQVECCYI